MYVRLASFTLQILYLYLFKRWETGRGVNELSKDRTARAWHSSALSCLQSPQPCLSTQGCVPRHHPSHSAPHVVPVCQTQARGRGWEALEGGERVWMQDTHRPPSWPCVIDNLKTVEPFPHPGALGQLKPNLCFQSCAFPPPCSPQPLYPAFPCLASLLLPSRLGRRVPRGRLPEAV